MAWFSVLISLKSFLESSDSRMPRKVVMEKLCLEIVLLLSFFRPLPRIDSALFILVVGRWEVVGGGKWEVVIAVVDYDVCKLRRVRPSYWIALA